MTNIIEAVLGGWPSQGPEINQPQHRFVQQRLGSENRPCMSLSCDLVQNSRKSLK